MSAMPSQIAENSTVRSSKQQIQETTTILTLCAGNPPVTGGFPTQRVNNVESISMLWRYHASALWDRFVVFVPCRGRAPEDDDRDHQDGDDDDEDTDGDDPALEVIIDDLPIRVRVGCRHVGHRDVFIWSRNDMAIITSHERHDVSNHWQIQSCSTDCWGQQHKKHQSSASLVLCKGNTPLAVGSP